MRLSGREDIGVGIKEAFAAVSDVDYLERQLLRRGIEIVRTDTLGTLVPGAAWVAGATWNGRRFPLTLEIGMWKPPEAAIVVARSGGLSGDLNTELTALSRSATRIRMTLTLRGAGFRDRMFLNSVALGKARLARSFAEAVGAFARSVESRAKGN